MHKIKLYLKNIRASCACSEAGHYYLFISNKKVQQIKLFTNPKPKAQAKKKKKYKTLTALSTPRKTVPLLVESLLCYNISKPERQ